MQQKQQESKNIESNKMRKKLEKEIHTYRVARF